MFNSLSKKMLFVTVLLFLTLFCCFARVSYSPRIQFYGSSSFTCPTEDYLKISQGKMLPPVRTSVAYGTDIMALNFRIARFSFGTGLSVLYNTRSLVAGIQFLRPYTGIGIVNGFKYDFAGKCALDFKFRYFFCEYLPYNNRFDVIETEISPSIALVDNSRVNTSLYFPVAFTYKSDSVSMKVGIGLDVQVNFYLGAKHEEN